MHRRAGRRFKAAAHRSSFFASRGTNRSATEFKQKRWPVGGGPSSKTWPRWASQRLQSTSVRVINKPRSVARETFSSSTGCQKLGQPVPESNLVAESNSGWSQQTQRYSPSPLVFQYAPEHANSVPLR